MSAPALNLLSPKDAAKFLGLCPGTLKFWRAHGKGPRYAKLGRSVRYQITDLEAFLAARVVEPGAKAE